MRAEFYAEGEEKHLQTFTVSSPTDEEIIKRLERLIKEYF